MVSAGIKAINIKIDCGFSAWLSTSCALQLLGKRSDITHEHTHTHTHAHTLTHTRTCTNTHAHPSTVKVSKCVYLECSPSSGKEADTIITQQAAGWLWSGNRGLVANRCLTALHSALLQCLQFPAWEQPLSSAWGRLRFPAYEHLPLPWLGTFAVSAWDACQFTASERLPVCMSCLDMLAVPACGRLPVSCICAGSNLSGFALQFANRIWGTAKQLRNAEQKSSNQKSETRNCATAHRKLAIASNHNPRPRLLRRRRKRPGSRLT